MDTAHNSLTTRGAGSSLAAAQTQPDLHAVCDRLANLIDGVAANSSRLENLIDRLHGPVPSEVGRPGPSDEPSNTIARVTRAIDILYALSARTASQIDRLERVTG